MEQMTPQTIKDWTELVVSEFITLQSKPEWTTKSPTEAWIEASKICPPGWEEIIRVLAQGGEYYGIQWPA